MAAVEVSWPLDDLAIDGDNHDSDSEEACTAVSDSV